MCYLCSCERSSKEGADRMQYLLDEGHIDIDKIGAASITLSFLEPFPKDLAALLVSGLGHQSATAYTWHIQFPSKHGLQ